MKKNFIIVIYQMMKKILILLQKKKKKLTFYLYSLKKNIFMIINITFQQAKLFRLKENI